MTEQDLVDRLVKMDELTANFGECLGKMSGLVNEMGLEITHWLDIVREQYETINILSGALEDERIARIRAELHDKE